MVVQMDVPMLPQPLLVDAEHSIARAAELLFRSDPGGRRAIVFNAFTTDAFFYSTFVRTHCADLFPYQYGLPCQQRSDDK